MPEWVLKGLPDSLRQAFVMWWSAHRLTPGEAPIAAAFARWGWPMDVNLIRLARQLWTGPPLHEDIGRILACLEGAERAGNPGDSLSGPEPAAAAPRKTADEKQISLPELRAGLRHRLQQWLGGGAMPESDSSGVGGRSPDLGHGMRNLRDLSGVEALRAWIRSVAAGFGEEGASRGESIPVVDGGTFRGTVMQLLSLWSNRESGLSQEVSGAVRRVLTALAAEAGLSITGTGHPWVYQCVFIPVTVGSGPETLRLHVWRWAGRREPEHMEDGPYVLTSAWNFPRWGHVEIALVVFGSAARLHVYGDRQIRSFLVRLPWSELQATLSGTGLRLDPVSIEPLRNPESGPPLSPWDLGIGPWERRV
ncbi:MAG: hypothetical protein QJR01_05690 [Kyrpidia sp.]|nr:hypothetical protein [Kyrpidia sp.]